MDGTHRQIGTAGKTFRTRGSVLSGTGMIPGSN
jgi:hypothetical protein